MSRLERREYEARLRSTRLLVTDVDGVLTDGSIIYADESTEAKAFHVRDGSALYLARQLGLRTAVITGRSSRAVARRCDELAIDEVRQGTVDKLAACLEIAAAMEVDEARIVYLGDDLLDLPVVERVGVGVAVADAHPEFRRHADWITEARGGRGALREVVDDIITARDLWADVLEGYRQLQGKARRSR